MAGFNTQFHATLDELCDIIEAWLDQNPIFISAFAFPPCTRVAISRDTLREVLARPDIGEVTFTLAPVDPALSSASDVGTSGSTSVRLNIGRLKPECLEQSSLSTGYDDPIWKKINRDLKPRPPLAQSSCKSRPANMPTNATSASRLAQKRSPLRASRCVNSAGNVARSSRNKHLLPARALEPKCCRVFGHVALGLLGGAAGELG